MAKSKAEEVYKQYHKKFHAEVREEYDSYIK